MFLIYFDPIRKLYINLDASKEFGFAVIIYYIEGDPEDGFFLLIKV